MIKSSHLAAILIAFIMSGCETTTELETHSAVQPDSCKNIPKLKWQVYSRGFDAKEALDLATKLSVAAKADAANLKKVADVKAEAGAGLSSQLSKIINLNVKQESKVSQDFWEQDLTYRQSTCYLDTLSLREDLTVEQKDQVLKEILSFSKMRREYMFEYKKKAGLTQP